MVALYVALIINGRRTFSQVPVKFRDAVRADLEAIGLISKQSVWTRTVILRINRSTSGGACLRVGSSAF